MRAFLLFALATGCGFGPPADLEYAPDAAMPQLQRAPDAQTVVAEPDAPAPSVPEPDVPPSSSVSGVTVVGAIAPANLSLAGVQGITFDGPSNPLVIDGFGHDVWRLAGANGNVLATFPLSTSEANFRALAYDGTHYFTTRDQVLVTVSPASGAVAAIGPVGQRNVLSLAVHPVTKELWMLDDCKDTPCTIAQGARLSRVNPTTGAVTLVADFQALGIGQATAIAISANGTFYAATFSGGGYPELWRLDPVAGTATSAGSLGLAQLDLVTGLAVDPASQDLYAIDEHRGANPRTWSLLRFDM